MLPRLLLAIVIGLAVGALLGWLGTLVGLPGAVVGGASAAIAVAIVQSIRPRADRAAGNDRP